MTNFNEYLKYNPETGDIIWIKKPNDRVQINNIAGNLKPDNYLSIKFKGKAYLAHRLAWFLYYGKWPKNQIDHINGIRNDNRINNLRDVTSRQNNLNRKSHREKTVKYYTYNKTKQVWIVQKRIEGKRTHLGCFDSEEKARQFVLDNIELFPGVKPFECKI
jgi:hypothetical protein